MDVKPHPRSDGACTRTEAQIHIQNSTFSNADVAVLYILHIILYYYTLHTCDDDDYNNNNIHDDEGTKNRQKKKKKWIERTTIVARTKKEIKTTRIPPKAARTRIRHVYIYIMHIIYTRVYADRAVMFWNIMDYPAESTMARIQWIYIYMYNIIIIFLIHRCIYYTHTSSVYIIIRGVQCTVSTWTPSRFQCATAAVWA